jgi:hypothetical protein
MNPAEGDFAETMKSDDEIGSVSFSQDVRYC